MATENAAEFHPEDDDVFGRIASRHDVLCDLFSLGIHHLWKRRAAIIANGSWSMLLNGATGDGEVINLSNCRTNDSPRQGRVPG